MRGVAVAIGLAISTAAGSASAAPAPSGVPRCHTSQLRLSAGFYGEAATQFMQTFTFRNSSSGTCSLAGWPEVSVTESRGQPLATSTRRVVQGPPGARPFRRIVLRTGGKASFDVFGADWNARWNRACPRTGSFLVALPGDRSRLRVDARLPDCGRLLVAPLVAGSRDRDAWSTVWKK